MTVRNIPYQTVFVFPLFSRFPFGWHNLGYKKGETLALYTEPAK